VASVPVALQGLVGGEGEELVYQPPPEDEDGGEGSSRLYRTEVAVRRHGEGIFPVAVLLVFEDGRQVRHAWEGRERFKLFVEEGPAKLHHAVVDPERVLLLDENYKNNSRLREPDAAFASRKWASKWMVWLQDFLATFTFFS